jgi:hypothetical protein
VVALLPLPIGRAASGVTTTEIRDYVRHLAGDEMGVLTTGLHPDYHMPSRDTGRLDFSKLKRIAKLAFRAAWLAAEGREPRFHEQHG